MENRWSLALMICALLVAPAPADAQATAGAQWDQTPIMVQDLPRSLQRLRAEMDTAQEQGLDALLQTAWIHILDLGDRTQGEVPLLQAWAAQNLARIDGGRRKLYRKQALDSLDRYLGQNSPIRYAQFAEETREGLRASENRALALVRVQADHIGCDELTRHNDGDGSRKLSARADQIGSGWNSPGYIARYELWLGSDENHSFEVRTRTETYSFTVDGKGKLLLRRGDGAEFAGQLPSELWHPRAPNQVEVYFMDNTLWLDINDRVFVLNELLSAPLTTLATDLDRDKHHWGFELEGKNPRIINLTIRPWNGDPPPPLAN
ncbi:MAG: hypothetical protein GY898_03870 [Proteobacteria bacterium]|nr:hypothetical protein [Pseudomonadota bacterium]